MANDLTGLNSLRQALTPYDDVKFELNLNRHPKAHKNKSIVYAENMKLSKDGAVLENEESIEINATIDNALKDAYPNGYNIIHIIPCNTELVLFVNDNDKNTFDIWRYREKTNKYSEKIARFYREDIVYNGGKFSGTFTYTSNDSLIIAFCEYDSEDSTIMNPMMTINLGTFTEGYLSPSVLRRHDWVSTVGEFTDRSLEPYKLPICPEVSLPQITNVSNIKGNSYIGTYYVYIRYKINKYDYTQWFNIGYPIVNELKQNTIIHEKVAINEKNKTAFEEEELAGANATTRVKRLQTYVNADTDLITKCINLNIHHDNILYDYCQIGFICISKTYTKYFVTDDIKLINDIIISNDIAKVKEEIFNTNIYENYYNVKNIINKNNKLYISNYKTTNNKILDVSNVTLSLERISVIEDKYELNNNVIINDIEFSKDILNYEYSTIQVPLGDTYADGFENINTRYINILYYLKYIGLSDIIKSKKIKIKYTDFAGSPEEDIICDAEKCSIKVAKTNLNAEVSVLPELYNIVLFGIKCEDNEISNYTQHNSGAGGGNLNFREREIIVLYFIDDDGNELSNINLNNSWTSLKDTANINPEDYNITNVKKYNNLDNFIVDNITTGLCQGEVYDFYIHFIDKYGHITDGYKLKNNNTELYVGESLSEPENFTKPAFYITKDNDLIALNYNHKCIKKVNDEDVININYYYGQFYQSDDVTLSLYNNVLLDDGENYADVIIGNIGTQSSIENLKNQFEGLLLLPNSIKYDITWGDILDYIPIQVLRFLNYKNSQNEEFFKVPKLSSTEGDIQLGLKVEIGNITDYGDYVSYFISHKKLEKTYVLNGFGNKNQLINVLLNNKFESGDIVKCYKILEKNWDTSIYDKCVLQQNIIHNNGFILNTNIANKVGYANDSQNNRNDRNTTLYLTDVIEDFDGDGITLEDSEIYYLEVMNIDKNKYIKNSNLYRLGNILHNNAIIETGLNGLYDKHLSVKYGNKKEGVNTLSTNRGLDSFGDVYLYEIFGFFDYDNLGLYLSERAKFCDIYKTIDNGDGETEYNKAGTDTFYEVITTLNLFNYKISNIYDTWINFYNVFNEDDDYLKEFNRTIYRSSVISDEGRTNNWRYFENDAYKNIEENKGNITNLLAIGNYLYVHTEHSLFAFSEDNTLSMNNQNLQVATPDIFDTEYKEVFITKLGYGGLQDKDAWVAGQFGYIWFDGDSKKIFKIYGNSMDIISNDIQEWLENAEINKVRFANDIKNNRILIHFNKLNNINNTITNGHTIISYNILSKNFISFHNYYFENSYNTKNNLYYLCNNFITQYNEDKYGENINDIKPYSVSFIINPYYREIKYLENIIFKLRQRVIRNIDNSYWIIDDSIYFPVEKEILPFQPKSIRVYNDLVDTDPIFCDSIDKDTGMPKNNVENYRTPYWDLGNWNLSFLRDVEHYPMSEYESNYCSRLFGNYFVITFDFGHVNTLIEFENLDVQLTKDKEL